MAKPKQNAKPTVAAITLAMIVAATIAGGFEYTNAATHAPLVAEGLVEVNSEMKNEAGDLATRATEKGIAQVNAEAASAPSAGSTATAVKSAFALDDAIEMPKTKRGGRTGEMYPFDSMTVGQSFFVAATEDKPDPAKSLASTVSSATARYAVGTGQMEDVKVKQYQVGEDGKRVKGEDGHLIQIGEVVESREVMNETRKFVVRAFEQNGVKGARVWRTA